MERFIVINDTLRQEFFIADKAKSVLNKAVHSDLFVYALGVRSMEEAMDAAISVAKGMNAAISDTTSAGARGSVLGYTESYFHPNIGRNWSMYRFKTKAIDDFRPLIFNPKYPWHCVSISKEYAEIIAYIPDSGNDAGLRQYWDDAFDISLQHKRFIEFTSEFAKPSWFVEG